MIRKILDSKVVRIVSTLMQWLIGIILVILVCLTLFQSISKQGDFLGYRVYIVGSESMVPLYYVGDTLLVKEMPIENIEVGDSITYMGKYESLDGLIITHQLKNKELDSNGDYVLHVKGIANDVEDPTIKENQVLGKVVYKFLLLSFLGKIITNTYLTIFCITVPIILLILIEILKVLFKSESEIFELEEGKDKKDKVNDNENVIKVGDKVIELPKKMSEKKERVKKKTAVKIKDIKDIVDEK